MRRHLIDGIKKKIKNMLNKSSLVKYISEVLYAKINRVKFPGSLEYWELRYKHGGTSGAGSYGILAEFKAEVINSFIQDNKINSIIEFGCGDGDQLSLFKISKYIGLDVSKSIIKRNIIKFKGDPTKSFFLYDPLCFLDNAKVFKAELALSLDVIYHLVEDEIFETYMKHLFSSAERYVIIYSSDSNKNDPRLGAHCRNRRFSDWIKANLKNWKLIKIIKNRFPEKSQSDFFIYKKIKENNTK